MRPYLVRALAANDDDPAVQERLMQDIDRGQGYFRSVVIEALGDHGAVYAVDSLIPIIGEDGPLHDDALLALGKIGDARTLAPLRQVQERAGSTLQPIVSAAACLLELDCEGQLRYIMEALRYGATTADSARAPIALALGTVALRNPELVRASLVDAGQQFVPEDELLLLRDAFDMLDEDFAEERFYVLMRRDYWGARIGSRIQAVAGAAIQILEF